MTRVFYILHCLPVILGDVASGQSNLRNRGEICKQCNYGLDPGSKFPTNMCPCKEVSEGKPRPGSLHVLYMFPVLCFLIYAQPPPQLTPSHSYTHITSNIFTDASSVFPGLFIFMEYIEKYIFKSQEPLLSQTPPSPSEG